MGSRQVKPDDVNTDTCTYVDTVQFTGDTLQERCRVRDELIAKGLIKNKGNGWLGEISDYENNDGAFYHIKPNAGTLKMPYLPAIEYKYMFGYLNGIMGITILSLIICIIIYFATSGKTKENTLIALIISAVITVITISIKWYYSNKERKLYEKYEPKPRIVQEFTDSMKRYLDKKIPKEKQAQFKKDYSFDHADAYIEAYEQNNYDYDKAEQVAATKIDELSNNKNK